SITSPQLESMSRGRDFDLGNGKMYHPPEEPLYMDSKLGYGHNPLKIGQALGCYRIVRKLGWSTASSVWLCEDTRNTEKTYVVFKVLTRWATSACIHEISSEYHALDKIRSANVSHPGFPHCLHLLAQFWIEKTVLDGGHICFVTGVLGSDLNALRASQPDQKFSVSVATRIVKQILLALDYLHRECGFIHTDIKMDNILVLPPDQSAQCIEPYLQEHPAETYEPLIDTNVWPDPIITVRSQPLPDFGLDPSLQNLNITLIDYGQSVAINAPFDLDSTLQPLIIRAPEVTLGCSWSPSMDIWTVGCLAFELLNTGHLFAQYGSSFSIPHQLHQIAEYIGPFEQSFLSRCKHRDKYFDANGTLGPVADFTPSTLEIILEQYGTNSPDSVARFMRRSLTLDPELRPSAAELLEDEWLNNV
ncbi:kinase-like domain-containing protein, partial [Mycena sp. CBHHK59/15]